jgi:formiminoglutamase
MSHPQYAWLGVERGAAPLLISVPHAGVEIPHDVARQLRDSHLTLRDTDWFVDQLFAAAGKCGVTLLTTQISRAVIDLNRDPSRVALYPGQTTTSLCPLSTFDGDPLYDPGKQPDAREIERRKALFLAPYHAALKAELQRLRQVHPVVSMLDAHSIRSHVPMLFSGELPAFSLGFNDGQSCSRGFADAIEHGCLQSRYSLVRDGRFKGGASSRDTTASL